MEGRVGGHDGQGRRARRAGSAGTAGRVGGSAGLVGGHGGPDRRGHWRAGSAGMAGRVVREERACWGQDRAGPGRSSCERTHEWFLEMCVPSELARGIKLATNLDS